MREWLQILFLVLVAVCGLLFVQICYDDFKDMLEIGAGFSDFIRYIFITMPSFLGLVLPLALLISLLFTLTKLHRSNEITAMRTAGVGFARLTAPLWVVGLFACALVWWLNSSVVPWSVEQSRQLDAEMQYKKQAKTLPPDRVGAVYSVAFDNSEDHRMWLINRYRQASPAKGFGISVSQMDKSNRETIRLLASEAWYDAPRTRWIFKNGRVLKFNPDTEEQTDSEPFTTHIETSFHEDPTLMLLTDQRPRDLSFFELKRLMVYFEAEKNPNKVVPYAVRYYSLIADTLAPLIVIAIAIPFAIAGVRVNPAVGVSKAIGLFILYYIFNTIGSSIAMKQWMDPETAAWIPNAGMVILATYFLSRLR